MKFPVPSLPLIGYAALAALLVGGLGGWHFGSGHYRTLYERELASGWERQAKAERVARTALQGQLDAQNATLAHNSTVLNELEQKNAAIAADRDHTRELIRRMFNEAARARAGGRSLPETDHRPSAPQASPPRGDGSLESLAGDVASECRMNAVQLDALAAQIRKQL